MSLLLFVFFWPSVVLWHHSVSRLYITMKYYRCLHWRFVLLDSVTGEKRLCCGVCWCCPSNTKRQFMSPRAIINWNQWLEAFPLSVTCTWTQRHNSLPDHAASSEAPDVSRTAFHFVWATATARLITALPLTQPCLRVRVHVSVWMSERVKIL